MRLVVVVNEDYGKLQTTHSSPLTSLSFPFLLTLLHCLIILSPRHPFPSLITLSHYDHCLW